MATKLPYRQEGDRWLIELRLRHLNEFFNSLDPSPFHRRDIDVDADTYIVEAAREFPLEAPLQLVVHLPRDEIHDETEDRARLAVHHYFGWAASNTAADLRHCLNDGRTSLLIGMGFLFFCMVLRGALSNYADSLWIHTLAEGLLIIGWVALWRPVDTFLYAWWPIRRQLQLLRKLSGIPVSVRGYPDE